MEFIQIYTSLMQNMTCRLHNRLNTRKFPSSIEPFPSSAGIASTIWELFRSSHGQKTDTKGFTKRKVPRTQKFPGAYNQWGGHCQPRGLCTTAFKARAVTRATGSSHNTRMLRSTSQAWEIPGSPPSWAAALHCGEEACSSKGEPLDLYVWW